MKNINKGEINLKIAQINFGDEEMRILNNGRVAITISEHGKPMKVDYCNDWGDAGFLVETKGISVIYHKKFSMWEARVNDFEAVNEVPTVAIALCYLKMMGVDFEHRKYYW